MPSYRTTDTGLASFWQWAGGAPWASSFKEALEEAIEQGWLVPEDGQERITTLETALAHAHRDLDNCTRDGQGLATRLDEEEQRAEQLEAALLTIAEQAWPEGMKAWQFAQLALWGPLCYWCRGFDHVGHPEAWHGCECKEDEAWD